MNLKARTTKVNDLLENIRQLRNKTDCSISDIKKILIESNNDVNIAYRILVEKSYELQQNRETLIKARKQEDQERRLSLALIEMEELASPVCKQDFYALEENLKDFNQNMSMKIEALEYRLEVIEDLLHNLVNLVENS